MWKFTRRPDVNEFFFLLNLKINSKVKKVTDKSDAYWYPWREDNQIRDQKDRIQNIEHRIQNEEYKGNSKLFYWYFA